MAPQIDCQLFTPQESVAACFSIYCTKARGDSTPATYRLLSLSVNGATCWYEETLENRSNYHNPNDCGVASRYTLSRIDPSKGWVQGNVQLKESGYLCNLDWTRGGLRDGVIDKGDLAYWRTNSGTRYWYHYGRFNSGNRS